MGDKGTNLWNLWWVYYAVFARHVSPLWCDLVFYPQGVDLRFHTISLANGLLAAPLTAFAGPNIAYNALFLLWTMLTGVFASLWARGHGLGVFAAGFGGAVAAFSPYRFSHLIHLNLFSTACVFCAFWLCDRMFKAPNRSSILLFILAWIWTALTDWYYAIFVGIYWLLHFGFSVIQKKEQAARILSAFLFPMLCMALLVYLYFMLGSAQRPAIHTDDVPINVAVYWSLDLVHLLCPAWLLDQLPHAIASNSEFRLHPGWLVMALGVWGAIGAIRRRTNGFLLLCAGVFFLISLGPLVKLGNAPLIVFGVPVYSPTMLYAFLPMVSSMRVFTRFSYIGFTILSLFAATKIETILQRFPAPSARYCLWGVALALALLEGGWRFPTIEQYTPPAFVHENRTGAIQEFPYTPTKLSGLHLYHQTFHHQPIAIAEFSRLNGYKNAYLDNFSLFNTLSNRLQQGPFPATIMASAKDAALPIEAIAVYIESNQQESETLTIQWPDGGQQQIPLIPVDSKTGETPSISSEFLAK